MPDSCTKFSNTFDSLIFCVARVDFVWEVFECKNCSTFYTGMLLAFTNLGTNPYAVSEYTVSAVYDDHFLKKDSAAFLRGSGILSQNRSWS